MWKTSTKSRVDAAVIHYLLEAPLECAKTVIMWRSERKRAERAVGGVGVGEGLTAQNKIASLRWTESRT